MKVYTPTIGIEVHVELKTKTKMFCNSANNPHASEPNVHICPICMGHPGTLPVINKEAVKHVLTVGAALKGARASFSEFDRKNYYYPDIPKGYQISQYLYPLVVGGKLDGVAITRVHLEEDTARSLHTETEGSLIDYNRAGIPLMELVTEPVIHDAKTAVHFARELQLLLRTLGVSEVHLEKGEMRIEVNISISDTDKFGTKVEVKNLNSFRSVEFAIEYETKRQTEVLERGDRVLQETRGWDESKLKTFSQRVKESASDYRYFPDPDLPKLRIDLSEELSRVDEILPELPSEKRIKYASIGIPINQTDIIISEIATSNFFDLLLKVKDQAPDVLVLAANYLTTDLLTALEIYKASISQCSADSFYKLMELLVSQKITSRVAKDVLFEVVTSGVDPLTFISAKGLMQDNSEEGVQAIVDAVCKEHVTIVEEFKSGKEASLQFLVGQGMRMSKGSANPTMLAQLFRKLL